MGSEVDHKTAVPDAAKRISDLAKKLSAANRGVRPLEFYKRAGDEVRALEKLPGGYKKGRIGALAKALSDLGLSGSGANNLYKMGRFAGMLTPSQVTTLDRRELSWRRASALTTENLLDEQRHNLIGRLLNGQLKPAGLDAEIATMLKPTATATTLSVDKAYARAKSAIQQLVHARKAGSDLAQGHLESLGRFVKKHL